MEERPFKPKKLLRFLRIDRKLEIAQNAKRYPKRKKSEVVEDFCFLVVALK